MLDVEKSLRLTAHPLTLLVATILTSAVTTSAVLVTQEKPPVVKGTTEEISFRRVNVVDEDGNLAFVLAAPPRLPGIIWDRKEYGQGGRKDMPGMIFYNNLGDEVGGLVSMVTKREDGRFDGGVAISLDQAGHDGQAMQLINWTEGDYARTGIRMNQFPTHLKPSEVTDSEPYKSAQKKIREAKTDEEREKAWAEYSEMLGREGFHAQRLFLGTEGARKQRAALDLKDSMSRTRLSLVVGEDNEPRIEFYDEVGKLVKTIGID